MSDLSSAQVDAVSRALINVDLVRKAAAQAALNASSAVDSTLYSQNAAQMVAFYSAKFTEWAYGTTGSLAINESRTLDSWLDEGDELAKSFAFWAQVSQYTTARGLVANAPALATEWGGEYLQLLWSKVKELGTGTKWVLGGAAALATLYLLVNLTGNAAALAKAVRG